MKLDLKDFRVQLSGYLLFFRSPSEGWAERIGRPVKPAAERGRYGTSVVEEGPKPPAGDRTEDRHRAAPGLGHPFPARARDKSAIRRFPAVGMSRSSPPRCPPPRRGPYRE